METKKFIPVFFESGEEQYIPMPIKGFTYYNIGTDKGYVPVLGLLFENYEAGKSIFETWKADSIDGTVDEFINLSYVVPPFPNDCWVYKDPERNYGKGYFVHIGPNVDKSIERAIEAGLDPNEILLTFITRYQWMDEINGSANRDMFKRLTDNGVPFMLMPIGIKNTNRPIAEDNLIIDFDFAVKMNKVVFHKGTEIDENDMCKAVLNKATVF